jgi:hypothetical protein
MLVGEWPLLVGVTLNASGIRTGCQARLFQFKTAMRIVTITASHRAFQNLVMEGHVELWLHFVVTAGTKLGIISPQHASRRKAWFLSIDARHLIIRTREIATSHS